MVRKIEPNLEKLTTFQLSDGERKLIVERLKWLHERWLERLRQDASAEGAPLEYEELQNLHDNLAFDVDYAGDGRQAPALEKILDRLAETLEEQSDEAAVPQELLPRYREIIALTDQFCNERLNEEYRSVCRTAAAGLCQEGSPVERGKVAGWAAGVVAAVGWVNFLGDPSQVPHVRTEEIAKWFGVSAATLQTKSKTIRDGLEMMRFDPAFTLASRMESNPLVTFGSMLENLSSLDLDRVERGVETLGDDDDEKFASSPTTAFQLKITLQDVKPAVWRRIETPDCTFGELHQAIQAVMGWRDGHIHEFAVGEMRIIAPMWEPFQGKPERCRRETDLLLSEIDADGIKEFEYMYDFGDGWRHTIKIEKQLPIDAVGDVPLCTGGVGACPPEDIGGPPGYEEFVEVMADPSHKRHEELMEWYGDEDFDPERFDVEEANRLLTR
jgi:hypothetical protein